MSGQSLRFLSALDFGSGGDVLFCFGLFFIFKGGGVLFENLSNVMVVILKDMYDQVALGHILLNTD